MISTGFICILFIAVGILGIYKKAKFAEKLRNMRTVTGIMVDWVEVQGYNSDNDIVTNRFPIYEYEWCGEKKRLKSSHSAKIKIGKRVHILIDPQTGETLCLEDEKATNAGFLIFGGIGVLVLILVLLKAAGVI